MKDIPRFLHVKNVLADDTREFVVCTKQPACVAEVFEFDSFNALQIAQVQPPKEWFIDFDGDRYVFAGRPKYPVNGKYYVLVIRKFWSKPAERDIPLGQNIKGGIISRMTDWFYALKTK